MKTFSQTIASNITTIAGLVVLLLGKIGVDSSVEEVTTVIGLLTSLAGAIWNWVHRYKKGDITPLGFMKQK